jgi:hypothetical protein
LVGEHFAPRCARTDRWSKRERKRLTQYLRTDVLAGLGDPTVERVFRMNVTLCIHRLCTPPEAERAMRMWEGTEHRDLAGQPIEILEEIGCSSALSTRPCDNPRRLVMVPSRPDLWVPQDCGACPSCQARAELE